MSEISARQFFGEADYPVLRAGGCICRFPLRRTDSILDVTGREVGKRYSGVACQAYHLGLVRAVVSPTHKPFRRCEIVWMLWELWDRPEQGSEVDGG